VGARAVVRRQRGTGRLYLPRRLRFIGRTVLRRNGDSFRRLPVQVITSSNGHDFVAVGFGSGSTTGIEGTIGRTRWDTLDQLDVQQISYSPNSLAISSDGRYALAAPIFHDDLTKVTDFCIVDFDRQEVDVPAEPPRVIQVAFRGKDHVAVLGCDSARLAIYDVDARKLVAIILPPRKQPRGECRALAVSSDGQFAITCHANQGDFSIRLWDLEKRACVYWRELPGSASKVDIAAGDRWFATGGFMDRVIGVWHCDSGRPFQILTTPTDRGNGINAIAISPKADLVALGREEVLQPVLIELGDLPADHLQ